MPDAAEIVLVLTTLPVDDALADRFARTLVDRRLAACVNVLPPMQSTYRWKADVEQSSERQVLIKTTRERLPDLKDAIGELHPYELPELLILSIADGSDLYLAWVRDSVR